MVVINGGGNGAAPGKPLRRIVGKLIRELNKTVRHLYLPADEWTHAANQEHRFKVPAGKYWQLIGGYLTRGVCTATALVDIRTPNNVARRRLLVLASGASDTTDIPDNVARIREAEIIEEQSFIRVYASVAQNDDTIVALTILEAEAKT